MDYNTIVVGAGIGGITTAIYLKRANISCCIFEQNAPGGQLLRTSIVENYPALPKAEGATIAMNLYTQATELEIPLIFETVQKVEKKEDKIFVTTNKNTYTCKNLVIATGRNYKKLGLENEEKITGKGISYCAICDGALYKNKEVAVVGAGNSAFEEALYLSNLCKKVTIIARREEYRADKSLIKQVESKENIEIRSNREIQEIIGEEHLEKLLLSNRETKETETLEVEGCFIYIGQLPTTEIFENTGIELEEGYIQTNELMETNIKGIYACGDCRRKNLYQLVSATYDGAVVAEQIIKQKEDF